ncbi:hypothetical protein ACN47E_000969 [Coniothyrium glycines]
MPTSHLTTKDTLQDQHQYDAVQHEDTLSDSSTEVDEWDPEMDPRPRSRRTRRATWRKLGRYRWMLDTALLVVTVGLLVEKRWNHDDKAPAQHHYELAGDITGFAPRFSQQIVRFQPDAVFAPEDAAQFWSNETQQAWLSIVPEGLGYVHVREPAQHDDLPRPLHDYPDQTVFTTSVTHQLHCLYTILAAHHSPARTPAQPATPPRHWHVTHCFEYLRQAVMCAGDVALEGAATTFPAGADGRDQGGSDGWDAKHVCRDYGEVYAYLEREAVEHVKWIASD